MQKIIGSSILLLSVICLLLSFSRVRLHAGSPASPASGDRQAARPSDAGGFAVVELFTSEGCSSCPPADELAARIASQYRWNVYVLCFHVDYWDQLGWKDIYSNAEYTQRQRDYARTFYINSIYTPQAIVNGRAQMVGSNEEKLKSTLESELGATRNIKMNLKATVTDAQRITVSCQPDQPNGAAQDVAQSAVLHVALIQLKATSQVLRGENGGKQLKHVNVVRAFKSVAPDPKGRTVELNIPTGLTAKECKVIAFLQDRNNMQIVAADEAAIK